MKKLLPFLLILLSFNLYATEEILKYHSDILVNKDRSITVTETIVVNVEGNQIKRGIFRDMVATAEDENGKRIKYDLEVLEVLKDGSPENYEVSGSSLGKQIKIGNADVILASGEYTYSIKYRMENQVRFFEEYDELYWNVTGNAWGFTIQQASATIYLPDSAKILQHKAYTGVYGDTGCSCTSDLQGENIITYKSTQALYPQQGLTIAIGWNNGIIQPPTAAELRKEALKQSLPLFAGVGGLLLIFLYYFFAWSRVGRDPKKGTIIPRFNPPEGFSPAATRYVYEMGFDKKAFTASIVSMAVKGFLAIEKVGKNYELKKLNDETNNLSQGEKKIASRLFKSSDSITIKQANHTTLSAAITNLENQLKVDFMKINFNNNIGWFVPGILLSIALGFGLVVLNREDEEVFASLIFGFFASIFFIPFMWGIYRGSKNANGIKKYILLIVLFAIPIGIGIIAYKFVLAFDSEFTIVSHIAPFILILLLVILMNIIFLYLIKAPTTTGRKRMDEIEGLKMFMEVAEKHRLNSLNAPDLTPQLFEKLLPYAIALNVENQWGEKFDSILEKAIQNNEYNPTWYRGSAGSVFRANTFASTLGSNFSSSISSASTSPQSSGSSGSGGGGSSGGGGGGGGGGGW